MPDINRAALCFRQGAAPVRLTALSADRQLLTECAILAQNAAARAPLSGTVQQVFRRAVNIVVEGAVIIEDDIAVEDNIIFEDGIHDAINGNDKANAGDDNIVVQEAADRFPLKQRLYTLLTENSDNAPHSCRLALAEFSPLIASGDLTPGSVVYFLPQGLQIGDGLWIDYQHCQHWQPDKLRIAPSQWQKIPWQRLAAVLKQQAGTGESLFHYQGDNSFYCQLAMSLCQGRQKLLQAWQQRETDIRCPPDKLITAIAALLGLGIGLTPTGDDYLSGLAAVLFLQGHPAVKYRADFLSVLQQYQQHSTLLSLLSLQAAIHQHYRELLHQCIHCLIQGDIGGVFALAAKIKTIGSSSGCDLLYGMADACLLSHLLWGVS